MTVELEDHALKGKTDRGQWRVLALITLYLVLAVAVGVARGQLHEPRPGAAAQTLITQADQDAAAPRRLN